MTAAANATPAKLADADKRSFAGFRHDSDTLLAFSSTQQADDENSAVQRHRLIPLRPQQPQQPATNPGTNGEHPELP
jgi:hypothetical protein